MVFQELVLEDGLNRMGKYDRSQLLLSNKLSYSVAVTQLPLTKLS